MQVVVSSIRQHQHKHGCETLNDHSFVYNGQVVYVENVYGTRQGAYRIHIVPQQPSGQGYYDNLLPTRAVLYDEGKSFILLPVEPYFKPITYGDYYPKLKGTQFFAERAQELGLDDSLESRCILEAELLDIGKDCATVFDFSDLGNGVIHTDKGDITQHSCAMGQRFYFEDSSSFNCELLGDIWEVCVSTSFWYDSRFPGKYVYIYPNIPKEKERSEAAYMLEAFCHQKSKQLLRYYLRDISICDSTPVSIDFDWGKIRTEVINDYHIGIGGFIVIEFLGSFKDWKG